MQDADLDRSLYVSIIGSCATADCFRTDGWPTFSDTAFRVQLYEGRTDFRTIWSPGFAAEDLAASGEEPDGAGEEWGLRMTCDQLLRRQWPRMRRAMPLTDVLIFDMVSSFTFPLIRHLGGGGVDGDERVGLATWELNRYRRLLPEVEQTWLWDTSPEIMWEALSSGLKRMLALQAEMRIVFHVPPLCLNDGIAFDEPALTAQAGCFAALNADLSRRALAEFPQLSVLELPNGEPWGDPHHPYSAHPFHYRLDYYREARIQLKRLLNLPMTDDIVVARAEPEAVRP